MEGWPLNGPCHGPAEWLTHPSRVFNRRNCTRAGEGEVESNFLNGAAAVLTDWGV